MVVRTCSFDFDKGGDMADIILFLLFLISVIYCCDHQAYKGFEFLIHDHNSMWYGVGLSIIAAYIFYLIQIYLPAIKNKLKYADFITAKLYVLKNDMRQTIRILLGKEFDDLDELRETSFWMVLESIAPLTKKWMKRWYLWMRCGKTNGKSTGIF